MTDRKKVSSQFRLRFAGVFLFAALALRLWNIDAAPGWFRDEGVYLQVAGSFWTEGGRLGALGVTFVSPWMTHPPLYFALAGGWLALGGASMAALRLFSVVLALGAIWATYRAMRNITRDWFAPLLALGIFAVHSDAVLFHRMALPYHLLALEAVGAFALFWKFERSDKRTDLALGLACVALAPVTVYYGVAVVVWAAVFFLLSGRREHRKWALAAPALSVIPFVLFWLTGSQTMPGFAEDAAALAEAARAGSLAKIVEHYGDFFGMGALYLIGVAGWLTVGGWRRILRCALLPVLLLHIVLRKEDTLIQIVNYPVIPLLPFLAMGAALGVAWALRHGEKLMAGRTAVMHRWGRAARFSILIGTLLIGIAVNGWYAVRSDFPTTLDFAMIAPADTRAAADYINPALEPGRFTLATAPMWALLTGPATNVPQMMAYEGEQTDFYLYPIERDLFIWPPEAERAQFFVADRFIRERLQTPPGNPQYLFRQRIEEIMAESELVFESGEVQVYRLP